jgi:intein/homing endonuclease
MKLDNKNIEFSKVDIIKQIKLPDTLTSKLAEIIGVILGDGHIEHGKRYPGKIMYLVNIAGSCSEDQTYYNSHINPMFFELFNTQFTISSRRNDELILNLYSKAISTFFVNQGIKSGNKTDDNFIPKHILQSNNEVILGLIRGVFDTEGSITFKKNYFGKHSHPIISLKMKSFNFVSQIKKLLENIGFNIIFYKDTYYDKRSNKESIRYRIDIAGKKNLKKFIDLIGFKNPRHSTKIEIWNKHGFYPPRLSYSQRKNILNGKLNPENFYNNPSIQN